jgi:hypothetical protein
MADPSWQVIFHLERDTNLRRALVQRDRFALPTLPIFRWPLDHVLFEEPFTLSEMKRLDFFGSDHFPVLAELCYEPEAASRQEAPTARQDDREEAQEKIQEGKEPGD